MNRCLGCMRELPQDSNLLPVCPYCGYVQDAQPKEAYHLRPGSMLHDRYLVGRVLGYGGFGVTYVGWDEKLERKVAIKEYLPSAFATRLPGNTRVTAYTGEATEQYNAGLGRFIEEARNLAQFNGTPGIVDIYDTFSQNGTAYIVMQFLQGRDVKTVLAANGPMSYDEALPIVLSLCDTLSQVHAKGVIHRDIAPDNIFLTDDGGVKLLDFGASRYATSVNSKSLSVILKSGYAPEEQYRSRGNQGPWSDVYALAATFYKMLTGKTPPDSMERAVQDELKEPSKLGADLPKSAENAILNALSVRQADRTQSVAAFKHALEDHSVKRTKITTTQKEDTGKVPRWVQGSLALLVVALLVAGGWMISRRNTQQAGTLEDHYGSAVPEGSVNAPGLVNLPIETGKQQAQDAGLDFLIVGTEYDGAIEKGRILSQDPPAGKIVELGKQISVTISGGAPAENPLLAMAEATKGASPTPVATPQPDHTEALQQTAMIAPQSEAPLDLGFNVAATGEAIATIIPEVKPLPTAAPTNAPSGELPDLTYMALVDAFPILQATVGIDQFAIAANYNEDVADSLIYQQEILEDGSVVVHVSVGRREEHRAGEHKFGRMHIPFLNPSSSGTEISYLVAGFSYDSFLTFSTDVLVSLDGVNWFNANPKNQEDSGGTGLGSSAAHQIRMNNTTFSDDLFFITFDLSTYMARDYPELADQELFIRVQRSEKNRILDDMILPQTYRFSYEGHSEITSARAVGQTEVNAWLSEGIIDEDVISALQYAMDTEIEMRGTEDFIVAFTGVFTSPKHHAQIDNLTPKFCYTAGGERITMARGDRDTFGLTVVGTMGNEIDVDGNVFTRVTYPARASFHMKEILPNYESWGAGEVEAQISEILGYQKGSRSFSGSLLMRYLPVVSDTVLRGKVVDYVVALSPFGSSDPRQALRLYISIGEESYAPSVFLLSPAHVGPRGTLISELGIYNGGRYAWLTTGILTNVNKEQPEWIPYETEKKESMAYNTFEFHDFPYPMIQSVMVDIEAIANELNNPPYLELMFTISDPELPSGEGLLDYVVWEYTKQ